MMRRGLAGIVAVGIVAASPVAGEPAPKLTQALVERFEGAFKRRYKPLIPISNRARFYAVDIKGGRAIVGVIMQRELSRNTRPRLIQGQPVDGRDWPRGIHILPAENLPAPMVCVAAPCPSAYLYVRFNPYTLEVIDTDTLPQRYAVGASYSTMEGMRVAGERGGAIVRW